MKHEEHHIVKVGPVHAGVIEPGVFRFRCSGERVEELTIELGYQHRGLEAEVVRRADSPLSMMLLAEQVAGDTTIGHAVAMAQLLEHGACNEILAAERRVALEWERLAMNAADAGAMCGDVAYRTGLVAMQALRTVLINTMQRWSGNRFGRGLIRPGGSYFRLDVDRIKDMTAVLADVLPRIERVRRAVYSSPSVLSRLEDVCVMERPMGRYQGDLSARLAMRFDQMAVSGAVVAEELHFLSARWFEEGTLPDYSTVLPASATLESRTSAWRGEVVHRATTDSQSRIISYRIEDPSAPLWAVLAETMRGGEISDFPVCNKSFNLSYSGVDL